MARDGRIGPRAQKGEEAARVREAIRKFEDLEQAAQAFVRDLTGPGGPPGR